MRRPQVMVMSQIWPEALKDLETRFELVRCDEATDREAFLRSEGKICRAVILNGHIRLGADELQHLPNLELVACTSAGFEGIDVDALRRAGVALTNTSQALKDDVADTALMLILAARRHLLACDAYVRSGQWGRDGAYPLLSSLNGKRAGILGFGAIGQEIAMRLAAMKVEIGYCARSRKDVDLRYFPSPGALADWADILVVIVPGGPDTKAMVTRDVLTRLGPTGTLINVARGSVVDEAALIECLSTGKLGSAGLDVFQNEPHPDPALTALPNVVLYPHHASGTVETRGAMAGLAVANLIAHFENRPLLTPVDDTSQASKAPR